MKPAAISDLQPDLYKKRFPQGTPAERLAPTAALRTGQRRLMRHGTTARENAGLRRLGSGRMAPNRCSEARALGRTKATHCTPKPSLRRNSLPYAAARPGHTW
jgi:hypothetical protein